MTATHTSAHRIHYGWIIVATAALGLFSCFGLARYALGLNRASAAFATVTIFFGIGQVIGPAGAGIIARASGAFTTPYLICGILTTIATLSALLLPQPRERVD